MSTKPDYTQLDRLILERITSSNGLQFADILTGTVRSECERLADEHNMDHSHFYHKDAFQFLGGRLQALRKRFLILFNPKTGWAAVQKGGAE